MWKSFPILVCKFFICLRKARERIHKCPWDLSSRPFGIAHYIYQIEIQKCAFQQDIYHLPVDCIWDRGSA